MCSKSNRSIIAELELRREMLGSICESNNRNRTLKHKQLIDNKGNEINTHACCIRKHEGIDLGLLCPVNERINNLLKYNVSSEMDEILLNTHKDDTLIQFPDSYDIHILIKRL